MAMPVPTVPASALHMMQQQGKRPRGPEDDDGGLKYGRMDAQAAAHAAAAHQAAVAAAAAGVMSPVDSMGGAGSIPGDPSGGMGVGQMGDGTGDPSCHQVSQFSINIMCHFSFRG